MKTAEYREQLAKMFINCLQENGLSWKKEWKATDAGCPYNAITGKKYQGNNHFYLGLVSIMNKYSDPRWATFKQIKDSNWHLIREAKATRVEYWFPYDFQKKKALTWDEFKVLQDAGDDKNIGLQARYYSVFHASQIEGIPELQIPVKNESVTQDELINKLSLNMGVEIKNDGGNRAFYRPSEDVVHLPEKSAFSSTYSYNATALHELAHSTGYASRLNRNQSGRLGSIEYSYEELVAEISSCFVSAELSSTDQTVDDINNHKAYVQGWISNITEKPEMLVKAIKDASVCAEYMAYHAELLSEEKYIQNKKDVIDVSIQKYEMEEKTEPEICREISNNKLVPTQKMIENYQSLEKSIGKSVSLQQICNWYKNGGCEDRIKDFISEIGNECKKQELAKLQVPER